MRSSITPPYQLGAGLRLTTEPGFGDTIAAYFQTGRGGLTAELTVGVPHTARKLFPVVPAVMKRPQNQGEAFIHIN